MPKLSNRAGYGFKCPRPKCPGTMATRSSHPTAAGRQIARRKVCRCCGYVIESLEFAPNWLEVANSLEPFDPEKHKPRLRLARVG